MQSNWVVKLPKKFFNKLRSKAKQAIQNRDKKLSLFRYSFFALCFIFSGWLMWFTFAYYKGDYFLMRSRLWSDFAAHIPMIRSFSYGSNFPPEYPQFANEPIRYHFLFYMIVGLLEKVGFNLAFSLNLLSALGFGLLLIMIFKFAEYFFGKRKKGAILAGVFAVVFFLFNSSLSYVDFFQKNGISLQSIASIVQIDQFINFGPWNGDDISAFWNWNVYTNQRHLGLSFALSLLAIWPLITITDKEKLSKKNVFFISLIFISLPFINLAAYVVAVSMVIFWFLINPGLIKNHALKYFFSLAISVPSFYYYWRLGSGSVALSLGFLAKDQNLWSIVYYWWRNLGLYVLLWPGLIIVSNSKLRKWLIMSTCFFVVANLFQLSTDMINNHKLINFFQLGMAVALGALFARLWHKSFLAKILVFLIMPFFIMSGVMDASAIIHDRQTMLYDSVESELGKWLIHNTEPDSVFITTQYLYNPVLLVGRKTYLDYGYFAWSMGYQDQARREKIPQIFSPMIKKDDWCQLLKQEKVDYIYISEGNGDLSIDPRNSWLVGNNQPAYDDGDSLVFSIKEVCLFTD